MLEPEMKLRLSIDEVVHQMREIFNTKPFEETEVTADSLKLAGETTLIELP